MTRSRRSPSVALVLTMALLAAACGSSTSSTDPAAAPDRSANADVDAADGTGTEGTDASPGTGDEAPGDGTSSDGTSDAGSGTDGTDDAGDADPGDAAGDVLPIEVVLDAPAPATDPLETINPLGAVTFVPGAAPDTWYAVFDRFYEDGMSITLQNRGEDVAVCDIFAEPLSGLLEGGTAVMTTCWQTPEFLASLAVDPDPDVPPLGTVFPFTLEGGSASVTVSDPDGTATTLSGDTLVFGAGPLMVQIDPNTGGLAEPVTRWRGTISVADLEAALA